MAAGLEEQNCDAALGVTKMILLRLGESILDHSPRNHKETIFVWPRATTLVVLLAALLFTGGG